MLDIGMVGCMGMLGIVRLAIVLLMVGDMVVEVSVCFFTDG